MRFAKSIALSGKLIDARNGNYSMAVENTLSCAHCHNPVFWRKGTTYNNKTGKKVFTSPAWIHFAGAPKTCPFYSRRETKSHSLLSIASKGQREKLLLAKFWKIVQLGLSENLSEEKVNSVWNKLLNLIDLPKSRYPQPLPVIKLKEHYANQILGMIADSIQSNQLELQQQILTDDRTSDVERRIAVEAVRFLLIAKNRGLLEKLIILGLEPVLTSDINNFSSEKISQTIDRITSFFIETNLSQAYLLEEE